MKLAEIQGRTEGEQWFHLSETPVDLYAYRERSERWEPVALTWRGHARLCDIENFVDSVNESRLKVVVHAFADNDSVTLSLHQWRRKSFPGVKFLRFELFDGLQIVHGDKKPALAVWAPVDIGYLENSGESDIGVLVSPLKEKFALSSISLFISETTGCESFVIYETLKIFFEHLKSLRLPPS